jgi:hypothetical protein
MTQLKISRLTRQEIAEAFALVQLACPATTFSQWQAYADGELRSAGQNTRGFLVARDQHRIILGILHYEIRDHPHQGRLIEASDLLTCGAFPRHQLAVALALIRRLEALAQHENCDSLVTQIPQSADAETLGSLSSLLRTAGHQVAKIR